MYTLVSFYDGPKRGQTERTELPENWQERPILTVAGEQDGQKAILGRYRLTPTDEGARADWQGYYN